MHGKVVEALNTVWTVIATALTAGSACQKLSNEILREAEEHVPGGIAPEVDYRYTILKRMNGGEL